MDIDISDILAEVSRPVHPSQTSTLSGSGVYTHLDSSTSFSDHQLLVRAWTSERCSPSLLPYPTALVERTMQRIRDQIARIEDMTAGVSDPYATKPSGAGNNTNLVLSVLQTDLGRTQFLVRSYLRQRLAKLTRHAVHYLQFHGDEADDGDRLLSAAERAFLRNHQALLSRFYDDTFLASFPASLRRLDDRAGGVDMVEGPDGEGVVVVRCLREGEWGNEDEVAEQGGGDVEGPTTELRLRRDEVWVVRWRDVRKGVLDGDLELL